MPISRQILQPVRSSIIFISFALAFLLNLLPWQSLIQDLAPDFVALLLIYWTLNQPRRAGIMLGFLLGTLMDVADGAVLGQHALAYVLISYLTLLRRRQIAVEPFWHQAIGALILLVVSQMIMLLVRLALGSPLLGWAYFVSPLLVALLWTPLSNLMLMHLRRDVPDEL